MVPLNSQVGLSGCSKNSSRLPAPSMQGVLLSRRGRRGSRQKSVLQNGPSFASTQLSVKKRPCAQPQSAIVAHAVPSSLHWMMQSLLEGPPLFAQQKSHTCSPGVQITLSRVWGFA